MHTETEQIHTFEGETMLLKTSFRLQSTAVHREEHK